METQIYIDAIENELENCCNEFFYDDSQVAQAARYSLLKAGKRIRAVLLFLTAEMCGMNWREKLRLACGVEMVHCYSLIHDDLPCMDNDDMRRGMPSCHIKFGEEYALLAGDGLLTAAFGVIADSDIAAEKPEVAIKAISALSRLSGVCGMIGGQEIDLTYENKSAPLSVLEVLDSLKTGALIRCAAYLGVISACNDENYLNAADIYAKNIGHAFQIVDDILDVIGDEKALGKPIGSDAQSGKSTYVSLLGLEKSREYAEKLTDDAVAALNVFGDESEFLKELAYSLIKRNN